MKTTAKENFLYQGKHINPGDPVDIEPQDMEKLVKMGKVAGQLGGTIKPKKKPQKFSKKKYY